MTNIEKITREDDAQRAGFFEMLFNLKNNSKIHQSKKHDKKMADEDITREEKEKLDARLIALEDDKEDREKESRKAKQKKAVETEDNHEKDMLEAIDNDDDMTDEEKKKARKKAKKAIDEKETEKEKEQTAKIASMNNIINTEIKLPKIASYLEYRESVGDTKEVIEVKRAKLLKGSIEDINEKLEEVAPHMASIQFNQKVESQKSSTVKFPYGLGGQQLSGSTKSAEQMYEELYE